MNNFKRRLFGNVEEIDDFLPGTSIDFQYDDEPQSITLNPGIYKFQVWGAQGGSNEADSSHGITSQAGGKGGYSEGTITLSLRTTFNVRTGGQGTPSTGGFNGGGSTTGSSTKTEGTSGNNGYHLGISKMAGGGGATDVRLSDDTLLSRMIVAGGGAGGAMCYRDTKTDTSKWLNDSSRRIYLGNIEILSDRFQVESTTTISSLGLSVGDYIIINYDSLNTEGYFLTSSGTNISSASVGSFNILNPPTDISNNYLIPSNTTKIYIRSYVLKTNYILSYDGGNTYNGYWHYGYIVYDTSDSNYGKFTYSSDYSHTLFSLENHNNSFNLYINASSSHPITLAFVQDDYDDSYTNYVQPVYATGWTGPITYTSETLLNIPSDAKSIYYLIRCPLYDRESNDSTNLIVTRLPENSSYGYDVYKWTEQSTTTTDNTSQVGYAGGGTTGKGYSSIYQGKLNGAGTGGSFGQGGSITVTNYRYCSGAGGGGWYGGGRSYTNDNPTYCKYSGGGSGFVNISDNSSYRPSGYIGLQLDRGTTLDGSTSFPAPEGGNETGHAGNGYARITRYINCNIQITLKNKDTNQPIQGVSVTLTSDNNTYSFTTDSNGKISETVLNGLYAIDCPGYLIDTDEVNITGNTTINIKTKDPFQLLYSYTGSVQTETLDPGNYKIECWGAQGGSYNSSIYGGKGGYSVGELTLEEETTLYIYVGGEGIRGTEAGTQSGGFNGGGDGYSSTANLIGSGGGASDVRIGSDSLYARVIVAGGGGGFGSYSSSYRYSGGTGGGISGGTGGQRSTSYRSGTGGSATSYGTSYYNTVADNITYGNIAAFSLGGSANGTSYQISGGGGGWYGGGYSSRGAAGGGSGYVYTSNTASLYPAGCLLNLSYYLTNAQTRTGTQSNPSISGSTNETGHTGNGNVKITQIM